jgi:AraC family transcriptional activator of mtrCDE
MSMEADRLVDALVRCLDVEASMFHVGQYCGQWQASTAGHMRASFHLVLHGRCEFSHGDGTRVELCAGEGVFLLRDKDHCLTSLPPTSASGGADLRAQGQGQGMVPLDAERPGSTGLACGFFHFVGPFSRLLAASLPDHLLVRKGDDALQAAPALFSLILQEAQRDPQGNLAAPNPVMERLISLLFFHVVRRVASEVPSAAGLWGLARRPEFGHLLQAWLKQPDQDWTLERMAEASHMSRATFCKHFTEATGQAPAQFLTHLRMNLAVQRLRAGETVEQTADSVGYRSTAAFSRAFKKVTGLQPGGIRRTSPSHGQTNGHESATL